MRLRKVSDIRKVFILSHSLCQRSDFHLPSKIPDTPLPLNPSQAHIFNLQLRPRLFFIIPLFNFPAQYFNSY